MSNKNLKGKEILQVVKVIKVNNEVLGYLVKALKDCCVSKDFQDVQLKEGETMLLISSNLAFTLSAPEFYNNSCISAMGKPVYWFLNPDPKNFYVKVGYSDDDLVDPAEIDLCKEINDLPEISMEELSAEDIEYVKKEEDQMKYFSSINRMLVG